MLIQQLGEIRMKSQKTESAGGDENHEYYQEHSNIYDEKNRQNNS